MSFHGLSETLIEINREIRNRQMVLDAAVKIGCDNLPTIAVNRSEIAELEQIRANLEAIQGRVK
ncbi:MAG: hypothetical protein WC455_16730 [Dehalococcoidia bacterium]|jgi:hypothetical protein